MACGWRRDRRDPFVKRASSRIANGWRNWRTGTAFHDISCPLRVMRSEVRGVFVPFDGLHRYLPMLASLAGYRVVEVPIRHRPRKYGRSHFGVWNRLFVGLRDLRTVRWMQKTRMTYRVEAVDDVTGTTDDRPGTGRSVVLGTGPLVEERRRHEQHAEHQEGTDPVGGGELRHVEEEDLA